MAQQFSFTMPSNQGEVWSLEAATSMIGQTMELTDESNQMRGTGRIIAAQVVPGGVRITMEADE